MTSSRKVEGDFGFCRVWLHPELIWSQFMMWPVTIFERPQPGTAGSGCATMFHLVAQFRYLDFHTIAFMASSNGLSSSPSSGQPMPQGFTALLDTPLYLHFH